MTETALPSMTERHQRWLKRLGACEAVDKATIEYPHEHVLSPCGMYSARQDLLHKGEVPPPGKPRLVRAGVAALES